MMITDAQIHIWEPESSDRTWPPGGRARAHRESFSSSEAIEEMDQAGVDRAILIPPSFEGDRNDTSLRAVEEYPNRFRVMGRLALDRPESRDILPTWLSQPGMLGIRHTFSKRSESWLDDGTADWFWPAAEAAAIPVMVYSPGLLDRIGAIANNHPGLPIIIDHFGIRAGAKDEAINPFLDALVQLADLPNIHVKASALPTNTSESFPFSPLSDRIKLVLDHFGPKRVFWGSDLTRLPCTYAECRKHFTNALEFIDPEDLEWVIGRGISELLGWTHPSS